MLFPKVTRSKKEFVRHIVETCEAWEVSNAQKEAWIKKIEECLCLEAHYFCDMIYLHRFSPHLILHEFIHHIAKELRSKTNSSFFFFLDDFIDIFDILFFHKGKVRLTLKGWNY